MELMVFYIFGGLAVVTALLTVTRLNPINSALWLVLCFFAFAGLYVSLQAHFIAILQILLYAGAIMVLFIFVIMLLNLGPDELKRRLLRFRNLIGGVLAFYLALILSFALIRPESDKLLPEITADFGNVAPVGKLLFTKYLIPFELASVLLLVAIIGSVILAKRKL